MEEFTIKKKILNQKYKERLQKEIQVRIQNLILGIPRFS